MVEARDEEPEELYRFSIGISNLPFRSTKQKKRYYGFLLQAYGTEAELEARKQFLINKFLDLSAPYVKSKAYINEQMGIEDPTPALISPEFSGIWEFRVEKDGYIESEKDGVF
jgi:hypothetical protein